MLSFLGAALTGPQGLIVLGMGAAGFAGLAVLANALVASVIPAIKKISTIKIPDPVTFKAVSAVVVGVLDAVVKFTSNLGTIIDAITPGWFDKGSFQDNMSSVASFVETLLSGGFGR